MAERLDTSSPSGRVIWYLAKIWLGSQTRMASEIKITQAAISKVVLGRRNPGRKLLMAVAAHPLVNAEWLLRGLGSPLRDIDLSGPDAAGHRMIPIASRLLPPGLVEDFQKYLSNKSLPVVAADHRPTRYFFRVGPDDMVEPFVRVNDLLLIESCLPRLGAGIAADEIYVTRFPGQEPRLRRLEFDEQRQVFVDPVSPQTPRSPAAREERGGHRNLLRRSSEKLGKTTEGEPEKRRAQQPPQQIPAKSAEDPTVPVERVVGFVVELRRRGDHVASARV